MVRIGTSGYNHRDWIGSFYPADMGPARYLARYGDEFDLCELSVAVHRTPAPDEAHRILDESEGRLLFTVLAPRALLAPFRPAGAGLPQVGAGFLVSDGPVEIAGRDYAVGTSSGPGQAAAEPRATWLESASGTGRRVRSESTDGLLAGLRAGLEPYASAGRFGGIVLPLPRSVAANEASLATIARYCDRLEDLPLLIEPRDASWAEERVLEQLRELGVGFVLADGPEAEGPSFGPDRGGARPLPARRHAPFAPVTGPIAYVRFHGRDGETRWAGGAARRDYLYSWEELVGWLPSLRALASRARDLCVIFNNPWRGRAIENAQMLRRLMGPSDRREEIATRAGPDAFHETAVARSRPNDPAERTKAAEPDVFHAGPQSGSVDPAGEASSAAPDVFHPRTRGGGEVSGMTQP